MHLRLVHLKLRDGSLWALREHYESVVLPTLEEVDGCLYAALLRRTNAPGPEECDSLTLWESAAAAEAYVSGGVYDDLLDGADPFLASAVEWQADLAHVLPGERPPLPDPRVEDYPIEVSREGPGVDRQSPHYLRIVDNRIEPARFDEVRKAYEEVVAPTLLATPGCTAAYLLEGLNGRSEALSLTFWADEASAVRYEASPLFEELAGVLRPYLLGVYQWRLSLGPERGSREVGARDLEVRAFHVLSGRRLDPAPA